MRYKIDQVENQFQFHIGAIRRIELAVIEKYRDSFNSILVQLEDACRGISFYGS